MIWLVFSHHWTGAQSLYQVAKPKAGPAMPNLDKANKVVRTNIPKAARKTKSSWTFAE